MKKLLDNMRVVIVISILIVITTIAYLVGRFYPKLGNNLSDLLNFIYIVVFIIVAYEGIRSGSKKE